MFTLGFQPATNAKGLSKLLFQGAEKKEGKKIKTDKQGQIVIDPETNEPEIIDWSLINLKFLVMGLVKGQWQMISITCTEKYSEQNLLGKTLTNMGFIPSKAAKIYDDEGFEIIDIDTDDEGFTTAETDIVTEINMFLDKAFDKPFIARVYKPVEGSRKNFWQIDIDTLKPYEGKGK